MMDYEKLNKLIRDVENEEYISLGDIEYCYLQEELYAVREKWKKFPVFIRASSPEKALNQYNSFYDFNGYNSVAKDVEGKPRLTLVPTGIIWAIAKAREYGVKKYGDPDNWRKVDPQHYRDAAYRHWLKYIDDPSGKDEESGLPHLAHVATNVAFLLEYHKKKKRGKE